MIPKKIYAQAFTFLITALFITGLLAISAQNYLLFHLLIELTCIIIASCIFVFTWNTHEQMDNHFFAWLGISFQFVGGIMLIHTLTYPGMNLVQGVDANTPAQLWVAARFLQSATLLGGFAFLRRRCTPHYMLIGFLTVTILLLGAISLNIFPDCFLPEQGTTRFRIFAELLIAFLFFLSIAALFVNREQFGRRTFKLLAISVVLNIFAELMLIWDASPTDPFNAIGHVFVLLSYLLLSIAIIEVGLKQPQELLYRQLVRKEELLKESLKTAEHIAVTDFLTGAYNRRYFVDQMIFELERANRYNRNLSVILIDLNGFKKVNDQWGHTIGDEVLKLFTSWLTHQLRQVDVVARYGGDEFVVLVPETDQKGINEVVERLKKELHQQVFETSSHRIQLAASFGTASYSPHTATMDQLLNKADQELYRDKQH